MGGLLRCPVVVYTYPCIVVGGKSGTPTWTDRLIKEVGWGWGVWRREEMREMVRHWCGQQQIFPGKTNIFKEKEWGREGLALGVTVHSYQHYIIIILCKCKGETVIQNSWWRLITNHERDKINNNIIIIIALSLFLFRLSLWQESHSDFRCRRGCNETADWAWSFSTWLHEYGQHQMASDTGQLSPVHRGRPIQTGREDRVGMWGRGVFVQPVSLSWGSSL